MKIGTFVGVAIAGVIIVALTMATLAFQKRADDTATQLVRARAEVQELRGRGRRVPMSWEDSLREFAGQEQVPYPRFRGFSGPPRMTAPRTDDGGRFAGAFEARDRRRRTIDLWFQQTIAELNDRARTATSKETADVSAQLAAALAKLNDLRPKWDEVRQLTDDTRRDAAQRLYEETRGVLASARELAAHDRQLRLTELARSLGQTNDQAIGTFLSNIADIYSATAYNPGQALTDANLNPPAP